MTDLSGVHRSLIKAAPRWLRIRLVTRLTRRMVRGTCRGSRAIITWRKGQGAVDLRGSIFCEVRDRVEEPLCEFYAAAIHRLMALFDLDVEVAITSCRAAGGGPCLMTITLRAAEGASA